jgi:hypothetical protein
MRMGDCVYSDQEMASFIIGFSSLFFWLGCQTPQFFQNIKNGSVDALSVWFLLEWFIGDGTNLVGAVLTSQLPTQIYTATLFVCMDVMMVLQFVYYKCRAPKATASEKELLINEETKQGSKAVLLPVVCFLFFTNQAITFSAASSSKAFEVIGYENNYAQQGTHGRVLLALSPLVYGDNSSSIAKTPFEFKPTAYPMGPTEYPPSHPTAYPTHDAYHRASKYCGYSSSTPAQQKLGAVSLIHNALTVS